MATYLPLDTSKKEIRLLTVARGSKTEILRCTLSVASLDNPPPYEAVSYFWGDPNRSEKILLNETEYDITKNLRAALAGLRSSSVDRTLWVDALCINQADMLECNAQVAQMGKVYSAARVVAVWLGEESDNSDLAMKLLLEFRHRDGSPVWVKNAFASFIYGDHFTALLTMFLRPYWQRIWVIQEVAFAKEAILYCGTSSIPYSTLSQFCTVFDRACRQLTMEHEQPLTMLLTRNYFKNAGPNLLPDAGEARNSARPSLFDILIKYRHRKASMEHDKVFALVGLSNLRNPSGDKLLIDYSRPVKDVYVDVVRFIVKSMRKLDVICLAGYLSSKRNGVCRSSLSLNGLPSWAPDWSDEDRKEMLVSAETNYEAAGSTNAQASFSKDFSILHAKGYCLGYVNGCSRKCENPFPRGGEEYYTEIVRCILSWRQALLQYPTCEHAEDALHRILILDSTGFDRQGMKAWLKEMDESVRLNKPFELGEVKCAALTAIGSLIEGRKFMMSFSNLAGAPYSTQECLDNTNPRLRAIIGLVPNQAIQDDMICVLLGCKCPVVLRPAENHYILIGEAYLDGYMYGEAIQQAATGLLDLQTFDIH